MMNKLEILRNYFSNDKFAKNAGIVIDSADETGVQCSMEITEELSNARGHVQGGAIFTLADLAFAVACNMEQVLEEGEGRSVGLSTSINFMKISRGKKLIAKSVLLSKGRTISSYRIDITDDIGVMIAEMLCTSFTIEKKE